jgi:hypothetical protein
MQRIYFGCRMDSEIQLSIGLQPNAHLSPQWDDSESIRDPEYPCGVKSSEGIKWEHHYWDVSSSSASGSSSHSQSASDLISFLPVTSLLRLSCASIASVEDHGYIAFQSLNWCIKIQIHQAMIPPALLCGRVISEVWRRLQLQSQGERAALSSRGPLILGLFSGWCS